MNPRLMPAPARSETSLEVLARSLHQELRGAGYSSGQVIDLASQLLEQVRVEMSDGTPAELIPLVAE